MTMERLRSGQCFMHMIWIHWEPVFLLPEKYINCTIELYISKRYMLNMTSHHNSWFKKSIYINNSDETNLKRIINLIFSHVSENMGDWICLGITNFFSYVILDHTSRHLWADNLVGSVITPFLHRFKCPQVFASIKYV